MNKITLQDLIGETVLRTLALQPILLVGVVFDVGIEVEVRAHGVAQPLLIGPRAPGSTGDRRPTPGAFPVGGSDSARPGRGSVDPRVLGARLSPLLGDPKSQAESKSPDLPVSPATSPRNKSLFSSSGIPHDKSASAKSRSKRRDLDSHLILGLYPHFSEVWISMDRKRWIGQRSGLELERNEDENLTKAMTMVRSGLGEDFA